MSSAKLFCAVESERVGDPLAGTGVHLTRNLLITWPRQTWTRSLRRASDMAPEVTEHLNQMVEEGRRVNMIYDRDLPDETHRLFLFPEAITLEVPRVALPELLDAIRAGDALEHWNPQPQTRPMLLCCTHGKKDKCCAKFGYSTYKQLRDAARAGNLPIDVWESSHLGGCRLAASAVAFPALRKYGRLTDTDIRPLLDSELADKPYLPCYRGRGDLTQAQQVAEIYVLTHYPEAEGYSRLEVGDEVEDSEQLIVPVNLNDSGGSARTLQVHCKRQSIVRYDTCADLPEGPSEAGYWVVDWVE